VSHDDDIEAIVAAGRRTRTATPRWQWVAAAIVSAICLVGFAVVVLGERAPGRHGAPARSIAIPTAIPSCGATIARDPGSGLGIGLAIGAGLGVVIGFAIGRQRRSHSSRSSP
jgi:hypothetical protein